MKEGSKVILFPGLGFAGVDERANETYLRKVISCLCSDTFVDGGLGTREILAKAYARLYLIGAKLEIPCLKSKCLQKLSGLYEHPVVFLDMAQIVYGNSLLGEDFQVYFRSKSEFSVTSSDQNAQALVKRLGSQGGHLATDILSVQTASFQRLRRQSDEYRRQSIGTQYPAFA